MLCSPRPLQDMPVLVPTLQVADKVYSCWDQINVESSDSEDDVVTEVKKSPPESSSAGFIITSGDAAARVAHLEHSVRFLQEQHRLMLSGLHTEIEALRERNRDLQFQLIFNKESSLKTTTSPNETAIENNEETQLKREVSRLEREAGAARGEARAAEARALQLQRLVDAQAEKIRELESKSCPTCAANEIEDAREESRAALRARLADAERLVRRLRADAERQRRELQCIKNSLHASLRATALDGAFYQNNYHFPPLHTPEFWREPVREDLVCTGRRQRRPLTLPELAGHQLHRTYNNHSRPRANGYDQKNTKKSPPQNGDTPIVKSPDEPTEVPHLFLYKNGLSKTPVSPNATYPELKIVVTKILPQMKAVHSVSGTSPPRARPRRRKPAPASDHT